MRSDVRFICTFLQPKTGIPLLGTSRHGVTLTAYRVPSKICNGVWDVVTTNTLRPTYIQSVLGWLILRNIAYSHHQSDGGPMIVLRANETLRSSSHIRIRNMYQQFSREPRVNKDIQNMSLKQASAAPVNKHAPSQIPTSINPYFCRA